MKKWYEESGLCFSCTQCGACCARPGIVVFTQDDIDNASALLNMSALRFKTTYLRWDNPVWVINVEDGDPCTFLRDGLCTIHEAKPIQCATYPFWPELLSDRLSWDGERAHCEGINRGEPISFEEIEARKLIE